MHLAELNIGTLHYPQDDPRVAEFMNNLDLVNGLAERAPGFVWRLQGDNGNATGIQAFADPEIILNMSVWESAEALARFAFGTIHKRFFARRNEWFLKLPNRHFVMWHVEPGHIPSLAEAAEKLALITEQGPSARAFGWESVKEMERWRQNVVG